MKKNFKGFTLAETMIVLAIMGVIASLTLPSLLRRQTEQANRTRIRKAMKAYDTAIQKMVIENNIKTDGAFTNWAEDDCSNTVSYFKISENGDNGCTFKTSDGVWWDISDIKKPIVAVRSEKLTDEVAQDENDNDAFYFITTFDPNARAFRTDDYAFETGDNKVALRKLYNFVRPEVGDANAYANGHCNCSGEGCCSSSCSNELCVERDLPCQHSDSRWGSTIYGGSINLNGGCSEGMVIYSADRSKKIILEMYGEGSAFEGIKFNAGAGYSIVDGNLTMGINAGGNSFSDMVWDKDGNLLKCKSSNLGTCTSKATCNIKPSPYDAPACQKGHNCQLVNGEWVPFGVWSDAHTDPLEAARDFIWENYQNVINKK